MRPVPNWNFPYWRSGTVYIYILVFKFQKQYTVTFFIKFKKSYILVVPNKLILEQFLVIILFCSISMHLEKQNTILKVWTGFEYLVKVKVLLFVSEDDK